MLGRDQAGRAGLPAARQAINLPSFKLRGEPRASICARLAGVAWGKDIMRGIELYAPREARHRRTWTWAIIPMLLVFIIAGEGLATESASLLKLDLNDGQEPWWEIAYSLVFGFGLAAVLLLAWVRLFERRPFKAIGLNGDGMARLLRGYLTGLCFLAIVVGGIWILGGYRVEASGAFLAPSPAAAFGALGVLLLGFIIQGSTEELLMRGWVMQLIASRYGLVAGIVFHSLVSSILHAANIAPSVELAFGLLNIVLVGIFLGLYAAREQSLWGVCGWHAAWNWLLGLGFGLEVSGKVIDTPPLIVDLKTNQAVPWWLTGGMFGPEASVLTTMLLIAGTIWLLRRHQGTGHAVSTKEARATGQV